MSSNWICRWRSDWDWAIVDFRSENSSPVMAALSSLRVLCPAACAENRSRAIVSASYSAPSRKRNSACNKAAMTSACRLAAFLNSAFGTSAAASRILASAPERISPLTRRDKLKAVRASTLVLSLLRGVAASKRAVSFATTICAFSRSPRSTSSPLIVRKRRAAWVWAVACSSRAMTSEASANPSCKTTRPSSRAELFTMSMAATGLFSFPSSTAAISRNKEAARPRYSSPIRVNEAPSFTSDALSASSETLFAMRSSTKALIRTRIAPRRSRIRSCRTASTWQLCTKTSVDGSR